MSKFTMSLIGLVLLGSLTTCVKEFPLIQEQPTDDLVVNGLIQANEPIVISVSKQIPVSSTGNNPFDSTLNIILSRNDNILDTMIFIDGRYYSRYRAYPGNKYSITIKISEDDSLYAETLVPGNVSIHNCECFTGRIYDEYGESVRECFVAFNDDVNTDDYYLLYTGVFNSDGVPRLKQFWSYWQLNNPILVNEGILGYNPSYFVFSDELIQGQTPSLNLNYRYGSSALYCVIQKISVEYYHFMKSLLRHQYNQQYVDHSRLDPIELLEKGRPTEIYTNVKNGKGIFASYSETIKEFQYIPAE